MAQYPPARRDFLKLSAFWAAVALPTLGPVARRAIAAPALTGGPAYNPGATFQIDVTEVEVRRNRAGRLLMARVYQPKGAGPFPTMLDLHGGAWNTKDRKAEEPMNRPLPPAACW